MKAIIGVEIECFGRYCMSTCPWMKPADGFTKCGLFDCALRWDFRKKNETGYLRPMACKQAEGKQ